MQLAKATTLTQTQTQEDDKAREERRVGEEECVWFSWRRKSLDLAGTGVRFGKSRGHR